MFRITLLFVLWVGLIVGRSVSAESPAMPSVSQVYLNSRGDACVEVVNPTDQVFCYSGYTPDTPRYQLEFLKDGQWVKERLGWCGTGIQLINLPPRSKTTMTLMPRDSDRLTIGQWRVSFDFYQSPKEQVQKKTEVCQISSPEVKEPLNPKR